MVLMPSIGQLICLERNVNVVLPGGIRTDAAFDLFLYPDMAGKKRGVLVVQSNLNFLFKDGTSSG